MGSLLVAGRGSCDWGRARSVGLLGRGVKGRRGSCRRVGPRGPVGSRG